MNFLTSKELSEQWGISPCRIIRLAREGRIEGAALFGKSWMFPENAKKPADGRTRQAKAGLKQEDTFRFPLFVNFPEESFVPPLSREESLLREAQADFYACEFQKAKDIVEILSEKAESIYVKICAHFFMCVLSAVYDTNINWEKYYCGLHFLLSKDFSHKKEMELFLPWLDFIIGKFGSIPEKLNTDCAYEYHPSSWSLNAFLSGFNFDKNHTDAANTKCTEPFGTLCRMMERDGYFVEAQALHMILFFYYFGANHTESTLFHLQKAVRLAYEHNLLFAVADAETYYADAIDAVLCQYPNDFAKRIHHNSKVIYDTFSRFAKKTSKTNIYEKLTKSDYRFVFYAVEGFTNKQVADILHISERTVAKKYNDIYDKLGIKNKQELITRTSVTLGNE